VTSQKEPRKAKTAPDLTSDEAMRRLFHPKVVEHAKRHVREAEKKADRKSTNGS